MSPKVFEVAGNKAYSDTAWLSDTATFWLIIGAHTQTIKHSIFFIMAGLIVEMLFMLFSVYNAVNTKRAN